MLLIDRAKHAHDVAVRNSRSDYKRNHSKIANNRSLQMFRNSPKIELLRFSKKNFAENLRTVVNIIGIPSLALRHWQFSSFEPSGYVSTAAVSTAALFLW